ncbi:MAG: hypothetical protein LQ352_007426 [Teloschistes flavicans]|nr:MAG: hypothetical protein LQ352_007426 [Teloschistes flavicans]
MSSHLATGQILNRYSYLQNASTHVGLLQVSSELLETGSHVSWAQGLDDASILPHIKVESMTKPKLRAFFLESEAAAINESTTDLHVRPDTLKRLYQSLRISPLFLDGVIVPNPWAKLGQASFVHPGEGGKSDTIECFYQYLNGWNGGPSSVWFSYDPNAGSSTYVLWDCPEKITGDKSIAGDLTDFDERLTFLIGLGNTCRSISTTQTSLSAIETLVYFQSRNRIWKRWVEHYNERARLMINLFFNIGTQVDSRTNLEIANLTSKIAVDAHRDSSSMITIAAVTMIFLPAVGLIRFEHLLAGDIAAVWEHIEGYLDTTPTGCSTRVYASGPGPGTFTYSVALDPNRQSVGGGSYLKLSQLRLPPDPPTIATLVRQRIIGLAWTGGSWFMNSAVQNRLGGSSRSNPKSRRDIRSALKGTVYAGPPLTWVYPTFIDVNGSRFTDGGAGDLIYKDDQGTILNLTTGAISPMA